jgi:hypothetical protein
MSLTDEQAFDIARSGTPVLCVDTCILLDIIRELTADTTTPSNANAAKSLLCAVSEQGLVVLLAERVLLELNRNRPGVEKTAITALNRFMKAAKRMHDVAHIFGAQGLLQVSHLQGHVERTQSVLDGWIQAAVVIPETAGVMARGAVRSTDPRTPAKLGKNSISDCVIIEAYLETASVLRRAGQIKPVVFVSSNTTDFTDRSGAVPSDLAQDMSKAGLEYQPNLGAAKHALGL